MMEAAVVDASVAIKWVLEESGSEQARLMADAKLEAPDLLLVECANVLWKKVRLGELDRQQVASRLEVLLLAPVTLVASRQLIEAALSISLDLEHPVYDCVYVALARQRHIPLVTDDRRLLSALRKQRKFAASAVPLAELR